MLFNRITMFFLVLFFFFLSVPTMAEDVSQSDSQTQENIEQQEKNILETLKDTTVELPVLEGKFDPEMLKETCESEAIGGVWQWDDPEDHSKGGKCTLTVERIAEMIKGTAKAECEEKGGQFITGSETYCKLPESAFYKTIKETLAQMNNNDSFLNMSDGRALCYYLNGRWDENRNKCNLCR